MESLEDKIARVVKNEVDVVEYDSAWPRLYAAAKPIIDVLVELTSIDQARVEIAPALEAQGYDFF